MTHSDRLSKNRDPCVDGHSERVYHIIARVCADIITDAKLFVRLVPLFLKCLPNDRERETLKAVGEDPGTKSAAEQTLQTVGVKDHADSLRVSDWILISLFGGLYDTQAVAATIGDDRRTETDECIAAKFLKSLVRIRGRDVLLQGVEGEKPWETGASHQLRRKTRKQVSQW